MCEALLQHFILRQEFEGIPSTLQYYLLPVVMRILTQTTMKTTPDALRVYGTHEAELDATVLNPALIKDMGPVEEQRHYNTAPPPHPP